MKNKKKLLLIFVLCCVAGIIGVGVLIMNQKEKQFLAEYSLFSWDGQVVRDDVERLADVMNEFTIQDLYQEFPEDLKEEELIAFFQQINDRNIRVFALHGQAEWGLDAGGTAMKEAVLQTVGMNDQLQGYGQIRGVIMDVEPYLSREWNEQGEDGKTRIINAYVDGLTQAYELAREHDLMLITCIPAFYVNFWEDEVERLIATSCDGVALMNYFRGQEYQYLEKNLLLAEKHGKYLVHISELQRPGVHELEDEHTYYNAGLAELQTAWENLRQQCKYKKLVFSYHYYAPLLELIDR